MVDNIYSRVCKYNILDNVNSNDFLVDLSKQVDNYDLDGKSVPIVIAGNMIDYYENKRILKEAYEKNRVIILTNATYDNIRYLYNILKINMEVSYIQFPWEGNFDTVGYYGIYHDYKGGFNELYFSLENSTDLESDILKGVGVEEVSFWLSTIIKNRFENKEEIDDNSLNNIITENDLTKLVAAQNITFFVQGDKNLKYTAESRRPDGPPNSYGMNFSIYAAHSKNDNSDYYYIQQEGVYNFSNNYVNPYKKVYEFANSKVEEFYCSKLNTNCYLELPISNVVIEKLSPDTSQETSSIRSGLTWNLSGEVEAGTEGASIGIKGGIKVSDSRTIQVDAVKVINKSATTRSNTQWEYDFRKTDSKFSFFSYGQVDLDVCSNSAHSTFSPLNQWIWKISSKGRPSKSTIGGICDLSLTLTSSRGRLVAPAYTEIAERESYFAARFHFNMKQAALPK